MNQSAFAPPAYSPPASQTTLRRSLSTHLLSYDESWAEVERLAREEFGDSLIWIRRLFVVSSETGPTEYHYKVVFKPRDRRVS